MARRDLGGAMTGFVDAPLVSDAALARHHLRCGQRRLGAPSHHAALQGGFGWRRESCTRLVHGAIHGANRAHRRGPTPARALRADKASGFSLVELLVAVAISLLLLVGVVTVFAANQNAYVQKVELDAAQEAFRFAHHSISRMARIADEASVDNDGKTLTLTARLADFENEIAGCDQALAPDGDRTIVLSINDGRLFCGGESFVVGLDDAASSFAVPAAADERALIVTLVMDGEARLQTQFFAALRNRIVSGG
ncbi:MAG: PilW family protein [Thioalkalivibrionaceae bacterium]